MTDRPILFSAPMVRALLAGRKTQTRRVAKVTAIMGNKVAVCPPEELIELSPGEFRSGIMHYASTNALSGPYNVGYAVGDRLWVREAWAVKRFEPCLPHERDWQSLSGPTIRYLADGAEIANPHGDRTTGRGIYHGTVEKGRPSIHMPRWASRLTLIVTDVRIQRLQDISEGDAIAEGIAATANSQTIDCETERPSDGFRARWNRIHGPGAWDKNPWVAAISFDVVRDNIDDIDASK